MILGYTRLNSTGKGHTLHFGVHAGERQLALTSYLQAQKLVWTEGDEGGVGDASLNAGDTCGGVEESSEELSGAASSESPEAGRKKTSK